MFNRRNSKSEPEKELKKLKHQNRSCLGKEGFQTYLPQQSSCDLQQFSGKPIDQQITGSSLRKSFRLHLKWRSSHVLIKFYENTNSNFSFGNQQFENVALSYVNSGKVWTYSLFTRSFQIISDEISFLMTCSWEEWKRFSHVLFYRCRVHPKCELLFSKEQDK